MFLPNGHPRFSLSKIVPLVFHSLSAHLKLFITKEVVITLAEKQVWGEDSRKVYNLYTHNENNNGKILLVNINRMGRRGIILSHPCGLKESSFRPLLASLPSRHKSHTDCVCGFREFLPHSAFRPWGQHFPGESWSSLQDGHSSISMANLQSVQETESSAAGEMWEPQDFGPQALSTAPKVLECRIFQNLTPRHTRAAGPCQDF